MGLFGSSERSRINQLKKDVKEWKRIGEEAEENLRTCTNDESRKLYQEVMADAYVHQTDAETELIKMGVLDY